MKISYKVDQGIKHMWHSHPAFAPVPVEDDELVQQPDTEEDSRWLQEGVNPDQVREFWTSVVNDLHKHGELTDYDDGKTEDYKEDPAYK